MTISETENMPGQSKYARKTLERRDWIPVPDEGWGIEPFNEDNPQVQNLNGLWHFALEPRNAANGWYSMEHDNWWQWDEETEKLSPTETCEAEGLDADFYDCELDETSDARWATIPVPANWEVEGQSTPVFSRACLHHDDVVGYYRRWIGLPPWDTGRVILQAEGIAASAEVYVNGSRIGYHDGGFVPFQMDVTEAVIPGEQNLIAIRVVKADVSTVHDSSGQWMLSGIYRDIFLFHVPPAHIRDFRIDTDYDPVTSKGRLSLKCFLSEAAHDGSGNLQIRLFPGGASAPVATRSLPLSSDANGAGSCTLSVENVRPWNPEQPTLYYLECILENGGSQHRVLAEVGFRRFECRGNQFLLNGEPFIIRGVVRHEIKLNRGRALTVGDMKEEIRLLRQANVNGVRSHPYPFDPRFVRLCAREGILTCIGCCLCGYDSWGSPWSMSEVPTCPRPEDEMDQGYRMLFNERHHYLVPWIHARLKNMTSIFAWSLANESGICDIMLPTARFLDERRMGRILIAAGELNVQQWGGRNPLAYASRFRERFLTADTWHYPESVPPEDLGSQVKQTSGRDVPVFYTEAAHVFCNRDNYLLDPAWGGEPWGTAVRKAWDAVSNRPETAGYFVFEWCDQAVMQAGNPKLLPQFSEEWNGHAGFHQNLKGLLDGMHRPKPGYHHLRNIFCPVEIVSSDMNVDNPFIRFRNDYVWRDLSSLLFQYRLTGFSGECGAWEALELRCAPGDTVTVALQDASPGEKHSLQIRIVHPRGNVELRRWQFGRPGPRCITSERRYRSRSRSTLPAHMLKQGSPRKELADCHVGLECLTLGPGFRNGTQNRDIGMGHLENTAIQSRYINDGSVTGSDVEIIEDTDNTWKMKGVYHIDVGELSAVLSLNREENGDIFIKHTVHYRGRTVYPCSLGFALLLPADVRTIAWSRDALWSWYPADHPDRAAGHQILDTDAACLNPFMYPATGDALTVRTARTISIDSALALNLDVTACSDNQRAIYRRSRGRNSQLVLAVEDVMNRPFHEFSFVRPKTPDVAQKYFDTSGVEDGSILTQRWRLESHESLVE